MLSARFFLTLPSRRRARAFFFRIAASHKELAPRPSGLNSLITAVCRVAFFLLLVLTSDGGKIVVGARLRASGDESNLNLSRSFCRFISGCTLVRRKSSMFFFCLNMSTMPTPSERGCDCCIFQGVNTMRSLHKHNAPLCISASGARRRRSKSVEQGCEKSFIFRRMFCKRPFGARRAELAAYKNLINFAYTLCTGAQLSAK